jgi:hypothetical protein
MRQHYCPDVPGNERTPGDTCRLEARQSSSLEGFDPWNGADYGLPAIAVPVSWLTTGFIVEVRNPSALSG